MNSYFRWLAWAALVTTTSVTAITPISAQTSGRPTRIIVPFAPGGSNDVVARILGQQMSEHGRPVVIENRPGGGATIGMREVAQAPPDGYTVGVANISFGVNPFLIKKLPYDTEKDFAPVSLVALVPLVLAVNPSVPARSVKELIDLANGNPGGLTYGSAGRGSGSHLSMELFSQLTGAKMVHVPYTGGAPQVNGALSGQATVLFATIPSSIQFFETGALIPLGVTTAKRDPSLPNVPTIAEVGVPGYEMGDWVGIVAPRGTPNDVIQNLHRDIVNALAVPDVRARIEKVGTQPVGSTPAQLAEHIQRELAKWQKVVETMGVQVE